MYVQIFNYRADVSNLYMFVLQNWVSSRLLYIITKKNRINTVFSSHGQITENHIAHLPLNYDN